MKPTSFFPAALCSLGFCFGYLSAYFLSTVLPTRLLWYYPLQHRFLFQVRASGLAMDFYGRLLLSFASGGAGLLVARLLLRRFPALARSETVHGLLVWVTGLLLFTGGLYISLLAHRTSLPVPLPQGYAPR